jgi:hypothetical protein
MTKAQNDRKGRWRWLSRPLVSIVVAYALVVQVFVAAAISRPAADPLDQQFAAALCAHDSHGAPVSPGDAPDQACIEHCLGCFAGLNLALIEPDSSAFRAIEFVGAPVTWRADRSAPSRLARFAIAKPRGPPSGA